MPTQTELRRMRKAAENSSTPSSESPKAAELSASHVLGLLTVELLQEHWVEAREIAKEIRIDYRDGRPYARDFDRASQQSVRQAEVADVPKAAELSADVGDLYGEGGQLYTFIHAVRNDLLFDDRREGMKRRADELLLAIIVHDAEVNRIAREVTAEIKAEDASQRLIVELVEALKSLTSAYEQMCVANDGWCGEVGCNRCGSQARDISKARAVLAKTEGK